MVTSLFRMIKTCSRCRRIEVNHLAGGGPNPRPGRAGGHRLRWFVLAGWIPCRPRGPEPPREGSGAGSVPCGAGSRPRGPQRRRVQPGSLISLNVPPYINFHFKLWRVYYKVTPLAFRLRILYTGRFSLSALPATAPRGPQLCARGVGRPGAAPGCRLPRVPLTRPFTPGAGRTLRRQTEEKLGGFCSFNRGFRERGRSTWSR